MNLERDTLLRLAPEVEISVKGQIAAARGPHGSVRADVSLLSLLQSFRSPTTLQQALEGATKSGWIEHSALVYRLVEVGVLIAGDGPTAVAAESFDAPGIHIAMLDDRARMESYLAAIRGAVRPGDVVVDLGTGTGVLAIAAAQAGAKRVYAIERSGIADAAAYMFERNKVDDRVTLVRERSTKVTLPEKADLLVSEIIGDEPFAERVLEYTRDAARRFMKEDARYLPASLTVWAGAVEIATSLRRKHDFDPDVLAGWGKRYGIDFSVLGELGCDRVFVAPKKLRQRLRFLGEPVPLARIELGDAPETVTARATLPIEDPGVFDAVITWFEVQLDDTHAIESHPLEARDDCHWRCPLWLEPPTRVEPGMAIDVSYERVIAGAHLSASVVDKPAAPPEGT